MDGAIKRPHRGLVPILLRLAKDRYHGRDILVHEFTHNIFENGVPESFRQRVERQYHDSQAGGRWVKSYAATNPNEFFAELAMWYFGTHGDLGMTGPKKPENGPAGLHAYDPDAFALLDDFFQGRTPIPERKLKTLPSLPLSDAATLRSLDAKERSSVIFRNETGQTLHLFWMDYDGKREPYGDLPPHASRGQNTFSTHPWLCADAAGNPVALFNAEPGDCVAKIRQGGGGR
jgi:von Hippel-Lindau disease tumor suppressor protein